MTKMASEMTALKIPVQAEVHYRMDVSFRFNVTPFIARQNVNVYLLSQVGNLLSAGEPVLLLGEQPYWKVPVFCAYPEFKRREKVAELAVDMNSGAILLDHSDPSSPQEIEQRAEAAHHSITTSPTG